MALTPGTRIGSYEVLGSLGAGGMGEVYRATDTKLKRQVAIKILPPALAADADRLARFQREAEVLASLNHPNIAAIYGLEESRSGGSSDPPITALVMELVEGDDLSQRIARLRAPGASARQAGMALDEALPIARQIAEALEAAHEQGIIHRDLKPANIKVRADGTVKVLDFGLAKALDPVPGGRNFSSADPADQSPTITTPAMTQAGMILGTAAYMAPEQARGKTVDRRADIWAFGVVLYEMLTGQRVFKGDDISITLASVLKDDVRWDALPGDVPAPIRRLLRRCLEKDPKRRLSAIADARLELDEHEAPASSRIPSRAPTAWIAAAMVMALVAVAIGTVHFRETPPPVPPEMRLDIVTPPSAVPDSFALSPDGQSIVFTAPTSDNGYARLWLRRLDQSEAHVLPGTEYAEYPFWSGDGKAVGYFRFGSLARVDISGSAPAIAIPAIDKNRGADWSSDGVILYGAPGGPDLLRVNASGGSAVTISSLPDGITRWPRFVGNDRFLVFLEGAPETQGIYLGALAGGAAKRLTAADSAAEWLPPDRIVYVQQGRLVSRRLDLSKEELVGDPDTIAENVRSGVMRRGWFSVSRSGSLAYRLGDAGRTQLTWLDRSGKPAGRPSDPDSATVLAPKVSPDGKRVALDRTVNNNRDVWVVDVLRGGMTRLTFDPAVDGFPVWSADGATIAFETARKGNFDIYVKAANGAGQDTPLLELPGSQWPYEFSRDGKYLLYQNRVENNDVMAIAMGDDPRTPITVAATPFQENTGTFSPDGRWVAYSTNESGRDEVVVQAFPVPNGKWQVSTNGGAYPKWSPDGKDIYFISGTTLMAAASRVSGTAIELGHPEPLFAIASDRRVASAQSPYDVAPDGRFLVNVPLDSSETVPITLVLNWKPKPE